MDDKCLIVDKNECVAKTEGAIVFVAGTIVAIALTLPLINVLSQLRDSMPKGA
jgi:hypothetical protein